LLDTNACIGWMRGKNSRLVNRANSKPGELAICSVVAGELFYGALRSNDPVKHVNAVKLLLQHVPSFSFDDAAAEMYARVRADLAAKGTLIGPHDLQIAGIALLHQHTLVTHNVGEFRRVVGLAIEDWES
jgi:tRNA(fMet)-specific endonuclease VapC